MRLWLAPLLLSAISTGLMAQDDFGGPSADQKVSALLAQMTLDEKIGQMTQVDFKALKDPDDIRKYALGSLLGGGNSDPADNSAATWLKTCNGFEAEALQTRLHIPLLFGIDAVHGHNNIEGAVIFPHNLGLGATHDPALVQKAAAVTAAEVAATGMQWTFAPCIAVAQDPRWGRTYESYSDQADLVSRLGAAAIHGYQEALPNGSHVLGCAKHFLADGGTQDGVDQGNALGDETTLRQVYLAPYRAAIQAGVGSIMVSYSSWNGQKMSGNRHLLTEILKQELGFKGFLVSDWAAIDQLSPDYKQDIEQSINAGLDMVMIPTGPGHKNNYVEFIQDLKALVAEGKVPESRIDDAVRRILREKSRIGLFEHPYGDPELLAQLGSPEHRAVARACVRESLVLLKNDHQALPLSKHPRRLVVVGEAADDLGIQCGGWTIDWQGRLGAVTPGGTTILTAIRQAVGPDTQVVFSPAGRDIAGADAVLVVIGEKPYAEMKGDRLNLAIPAADAALVEKAKQTGAPVVTVLLSGRPLVLGSVLADSDAVVAAWLPGTEGEGIADVLFGNFKPTGKLSRLWPRDNENLASNPTGPPTVRPLFRRHFGLTYSTPEISQNQP
jgi:beta-glucosidase